MKDLYFYSSCINYISFIKENENFTGIPSYTSEELKNLKTNEIGYLQCGNLRIHIILGILQDYKCPWCNSETITHHEKIPSTFDNEYIFYVKCLNCRSRGPMKKMFVNDEDIIEKLNEIFKEYYSVKIAWDYELL